MLSLQTFYGLGMRCTCLSTANTYAFILSLQTFFCQCMLYLSASQNKFDKRLFIILGMLMAVPSCQSVDLVPQVSRRIDNSQWEHLGIDSTILTRRWLNIPLERRTATRTRRQAPQAGDELPLEKYQTRILISPGLYRYDTAVALKPTFTDQCSFDGTH